MMNKLHTFRAEKSRSHAPLVIMFGGALLLGACSSDNADGRPSEQAVSWADANTKINGVTYRTDGTRAYDMPAPRPQGSGTRVLVVDSCKPGQDMIETIYYRTYDGDAIGAAEITPANGACLDGRLTPEDLPPLVASPSASAPRPSAS